MLPAALDGLSGQDRGFAHELIYGGLRQYHHLDALLAGLLRQPLKPRDRDELRAVFAQERYSLSGDELDEILNVVAQYV